MEFALNKLKTSSLASGVKCFSAINATVWWPLQPHARTDGTANSVASTDTESIARTVADGTAKLPNISARDLIFGLNGLSDEMSTEGKTRTERLQFQVPVYALSQRPMGRQDSVWSQITRNVAVIGIASNNPMPPQTQPQN